MLNRWRYVAYTDDGASIYQCLKCYEKWEARTSPGDRWRFCPYCGTIWDGQHEWDAEKKWNFRQRKSYVSPFIWVIQEKVLFSDFEKDWADTYKRMDAFSWGRWTTAREVLSMWKTEIAVANENINEEKKSHKQYCKYSGKNIPFCAFTVTQLRLIARWADGLQKAALEYLPTREDVEHEC